MRNITARQWAHIQWAKGKSPIHLFGNVYLVRHKSVVLSKWPFYKIKIFKEYPLDKSEIV